MYIQDNVYPILQKRISQDYFCLNSNICLTNVKLFRAGLCQ